MEKRVILAFVLSFLVLYAFRALFTPPATTEPQTTQLPTPAVTPPSPEKRPAAIAESATSVRAEGVHGKNPEDVPFETALYTGTFSNVGGVLKSYKLKNYS